MPSKNPSPRIPIICPLRAVYAPCDAIKHQTADLVRSTLHQTGVASTPRSGGRPTALKAKQPNLSPRRPPEALSPVGHAPQDEKRRPEENFLLPVFMNTICTSTS